MQTLPSHVFPGKRHNYRPLLISVFPQHSRFTDPSQIHARAYQPRRIIVSPDATVQLYVSACAECGGEAGSVCIECGGRFCRRCQPQHGHDEKMQDAGWYPFNVCAVGVIVFLVVAWILGVR